MKTCVRCGVPKPEEEFHRDATRGDGLCPRCKVCSAAADRASYLKHIDARRATRAAYYQANIERERAAGRVQARKRRHGGVAAPVGPCDLCGDEGRRVVDHDHQHCPGAASCEVCRRGFLCGRCNLGLGQFRDDPVLLAAAIAYLARWALVR